MHPYAPGFQEIDRAAIQLVGGKGANLAALSRLEGVHVPDGFCVTTEAFLRALEASPTTLRVSLDRLARARADDREEIRALSGAIRRILEEIAIPGDVRDAITRALARLGAEHAYAVRSSATAEDAPEASFAGQQDTWLNVIGEPAILEHIRRCWASLFTERAVTYRLRQGLDHRKVHMAVVVQRMVVPRAAGVLFTADPVTSNRKVSSIEAVFGLGEALVSGRVSADGYKVRNGQILERTIATKERATRAAARGGTEEQAIAPDEQRAPVLTDAQIARLERLGRRIEAHFGHPQDIEWCLVGEDLHLVQSRPITTLYPIPDAGVPGNRVYLSVGHQQMMTDAMKPLGLSLFQLIAGRPMYEAGGRLFVDPTRELASPISRAMLLDMAGRSDPLLRDALAALVERGDFIESVPPPPGDPAAPGSPQAVPPGASPPGPPIPTAPDPAILAELIRRREASIQALKRDIQTRSGVDVLDFILEDIQQLKRELTDPQSFGAIMAGMNACAWIDEKMMAWLGEKGAADALSQSVPNNVTSEMGLALLDVADVIRPYPDVIDYLHHARDDGFLEGLLPLEGGPEAHDALGAYLGKYGMRCVGEIDITRPRWSERPTTLVPLLLGNVERFEPGAGRRKFEEGRQEALRTEQGLLDRLRRLPDGEAKAEATQRMIRQLRSFIGYREYPKYGISQRYLLYKQALLSEAEALARANVIAEAEDVFYLRFQELREVVRTRALDARIVGEREAAHARDRRRTPPRVITSEGEIIAVDYQRADLPDGALAGLAVSSGVVEGRARVVLDMADADLEEGDVLVTTFTDPSWTPWFVSIRGLVTEVGGRMTHGAVIAREYGLPAVVGVEQATRRIQDGQRVRVNGTEGYVEILGGA